MIQQLMVERGSAKGVAAWPWSAPTTSPMTTTAEIQLVRVTGYLAGQNQISNLNIQVYQANPSTGANIGAWSASPFGNDIAVQINLKYQPMVPTTLGIIPSPLALQSKSLMRSEAN